MWGGGCRGWGGCDAKALESRREPWLGNNPGLSRSSAAGVLIWKQSGESEYGILIAKRVVMVAWGGGLHDQQLSIDQRLKNCTLKSLLTSKS